MTRSRRLAVLVVATGLTLAGCTAHRDAASTTATGTTAARPATTTAPAPAAPPTSAAPTPGPPEPIRVSTDLPARVTLVTVTGRTLHGRTPFRATVAGGTTRVTVTRPGFNPARRTLDLAAPTRLRLWLDPAGLLLRSEFRARTGPNPKQVAFSPDGRQLWVTLLGSVGNGVQVFDARTGRLLHTVPTGRHGAVEVLFDHTGRTAYVSQMWTGTVLAVDTRTYRVRRTYETHGTWSKEMALSPDGRRLYVSNWVSNDVSRIDLRTGRVRLIPTVTTPRGIALSGDGRHLYVAGFDKGELEDVDLATGHGRVLLHTGGAMRHLVADPRTGRIYADDMALGAVFVVDTATDRVRRLASTDHMPNTIDLSPDGRVLYVSCRGANNAVTYALPGPEWGSVVVLDTATGRELDAIVGGNQPTGLDVAPDGHTLAFTDFLDDDVRTYAVPPYAVYRAGHGGRARTHLADLPKH